VCEALIKKTGANSSQHFVDKFVGVLARRAKQRVSQATVSGTLMFLDQFGSRCMLNGVGANIPQECENERFPFTFVPAVSARLTELGEQLTEYCGTG
jgi:hypothetical protein